MHANSPRAIASDLTLYHEAKILDGIANDSLFDVMSEEIEEGRELFKSRVTPDIFEQNIYNRALVDVLVKSKGHVKSKIWVAADPAERTVRFTFEGADRTRLDHFLATCELPVSRSQLKKLCDAGQVAVNDTPAKAGHKLRSGDTVLVNLPAPEAAVAIPQNIPLEVLYEDSHLIVINKPPGVGCSPGAGASRRDSRQCVVGALSRLVWNRRRTSPRDCSPARQGYVRRFGRDQERRRSCLAIAGVRRQGALA